MAVLVEKYESLDIQNDYLIDLNKNSFSYVIHQDPSQLRNAVVSKFRAFAKDRIKTL